MSGKEFYTFSEYIKKDVDVLTPSAEDYIEMVYRLSSENGFTRVHDLAEALNVQPPSVTKMVQKLSELKYIKYEKYGVIILEESGRILGKALLRRHNIIEKFLIVLNLEDGILEETEKIEHTINEEVLRGIEGLVNFFSDNPEILKKFNDYRKREI